MFISRFSLCFIALHYTYMFSSSRQFYLKPLTDETAFYILRCTKLFERSSKYVFLNENGYINNIT